MADPSVSDFMAKRLTSSPASDPSVPDFLASRAKASQGGQAPTWSDDVKASAQFLGSELSGVADAVNPVNIAKGLVHTVAHPIDTVTSLVGLPGQMVDQFKSGDMDGLARSFGNIAGNVIVGKAAPEIPGMAKDLPAATKLAAQNLGDTVDAVKAGASNAAANAGDAVKAATSNPVLRAVAPIVRNQTVKMVLNNIPVVGPLTRTGLDLWDLGTKVQKALKDVSDSATVKSPIVSTDIASKSEVSPKISVTSASDAMGTTPESAVKLSDTSGKGYRSSDLLDAPTQQKLVEATRSGVASSLPAPYKVALVQAVKDGDSGTVNSILDNHAGVRQMQSDVINKVAVLARYAQDHGVDLEKVDPANRQAIADAAVTHAKGIGLTGLPRSGKYAGISNATIQAVLDSMKAGGN